MSIEELIECSKEIDNSLMEYEKSLLRDKDTYILRLEQVNKEYVKASEDGDRSENAAFEQALKDIAEISSDLNNTESQLSAIERCKLGSNKYKHGLTVTEYSTLFLRKQPLTDGKGIPDMEETYILKLFPYGVSDTENGVVSTDSKWGNLLLNKRKHDDVKIRHRTSGGISIYRIEEVY